MHFLCILSVQLTQAQGSPEARTALLDCRNPLTGVSAPLQLYLTIPDFHHVSETGQYTLDTNILNQQKVKDRIITHLQNSGLLVIFLNPRGQTTAAAAAQDVQGVLFRTVTGASQRLEAAWNDKNTNVAQKLANENARLALCCAQIT